MFDELNPQDVRYVSSRVIQSGLKWIMETFYSVTLRSGLEVLMTTRQEVATPALARVEG